MKKFAKRIGLIVFIALIIVAIVNIYNWIVCGKQVIKINTSNKAYTNSDLYVSVIAQDKGVDLDTKTKLKLLDSDGKRVKGVKTKYDGNNAILSIPDIEAGNYFLKARVSSKAGRDTVKKEIYISSGNRENVTINLDKGIYKPGDTVNFRALLTSRDNDEPISKDVNVCIYDGNDNKVYNENVKSSDYGIVSGKFNLASEVNSGLYKLVIKTKDNETTKQFKVNPYITPKYEVKINYDKDKYLVGDTAKITVNAKYFFGEPVKLANVEVFLDNESYKTLATDSLGQAIIDFEIKEAKTYNLKVEVVDSSNYYVEAGSSFSAGTDLFEIELLPEYGTLVDGKKNDIYVFTKNADGTPLKTYVTISSDSFTKQIATDENGIGKFTISVDKYSDSKTISSLDVIEYDYGDTPLRKRNNNTNNYYKSYSDTKDFYIKAEDTEGNSVTKNISFDIEEQPLLIKTDKTKYTQGEDIKIDISSTDVNANNIYFIKDEKLIKMVNTDSEEITVNLDDTYGLIDVYIVNNSKNNYDYDYDYDYDDYYAYRKNSFKKTIFIKPTKQLSIDIGTDKEEYKPGDKISISFNTTDEDKNGVNAALLISMLDNSILNLASNDLSIDNIKLALQNIKFSDELDAATLYSSIIDDTSEQTIMALLLKQKSTNVNLSEITIRNYEQKAKAELISIISIAIIVISIVIYVFVKLKIVRKLFKHLLNFVMFDFLLVVASLIIIDEFFWRYDYSLLTFAITTIAGLAIYILLVSKIYKQTFRTSISIFITFLLFIFLSFIIEELNASMSVILLVLAILMLILVIFYELVKAKKIKTNKFIKAFMNEISYIAKYILALIAATLVAIVINKIIHIYNISIPIIIICTYFFNYKFNKIGQEKTEEKDTEDKKDIAKRIGFYALVILAIIGVISLRNSTLDLSVDEPSRYYDYEEITPTEWRSGSDATSAIDSLDSASWYSSNDTSGSKSISSIFESAADSLLPRTKDDSKVIAENAVSEQEIIGINNEETEKNVDDNIRNVFLESMCFIPELITSNGVANLDLKLSDNITTWTIQTVGNTKDGRVGYGILDNVKVFKEFFVDFDLPKNMIETDKVSIPVTVYNYTENPINTALKITEQDWFTLEKNTISVNVDAKSTNMVYIPISVLKAGNNKFRAEVSTNTLTDIVEKECLVSPKGYKIEKVISTGTLDEDIEEDVLFLDSMVENTAKTKVKIYASAMAQTVEGMENIFSMPTGCFEQISSSLYPNILALKYLEDKGIVNEQIKEKALQYISSGYQKLLTYEVQGESGGYSLYGHSPAETVLTAYGLMEITDLSEVYSVDESVIKKMTEFLYKKQNLNGTFTITGSHLGGANSREELALNAYITWALSESNAKDGRLNKSVEYLKSKLDKVDDNYTLALIANTLANVNDKELDNVLKRLISNVNVDGKRGYIVSNCIDYYGSRGDMQTLQTVALTSMALSKASYKPETNKLLINYLISKKDSRGTWFSTQATILALKALNTENEKSKLKNQTIAVTVNSDVQKIEIKDNPLELYELTFSNLSKENKLKIDIEKSTAYYEVIQEYYIPFENVKAEDDKIEVTVTADKNLKVNELLKANIKVQNKSEYTIKNGMVTIAIPQGFSINEESLMLLENKGIIEKYEMSYTYVNIYLRNFDQNQIVDLDVSFRANYPVEITGMDVRAYDYYNPTVEGKSMPIGITVK